MKNRKGFTLVELLAVIAILAILVIMALPAVLRMYRKARIDSFQNEIRKVVTTAQQQFLADSLNIVAAGKVVYSSACTENTTKQTDGEGVYKEKLQMTGDSQFKYQVVFDVDGNVILVRATNATYAYTKSGSSSSPISVEAINVVEADSDSITGASGFNGTTYAKCAIN